MKKIFLTLVFCFAALQCGCSSLLYYPTQELHYPPENFGLKPEEVTFTSNDGSKIFGWYFSQKKLKKAKGVLVFYHGNGENLSSHYITLVPFLDKAYDFFIFDYQGYGRSEGEPSPQATVENGEAALRWLVKNKKGLATFIFAQSLGGAVALRNAIDLKQEIPLQGIVVDSSFLSYKRAGQKVLASAWITWPFQWLAHLVLSDQYAPPREEIEKISPVPLLVVHGTKDPVIDYSLGEEVFAAAKDPKEFWRIEEGRHTDAFHRKDPAYRQKLYEWLEKNRSIKK